MLRFAVLASGSSGNSLWVASSTTAVLVDCGLSARELTRRLAAIDRSPHDLQGLVLTHEHGDHASGCGTAARRFRLPLHATAGTLAAAERFLGGIPEQRVVRAGEVFAIGDLRFEPFSQPHDAAAPMGVAVHCGSLKLTLLTDLGYITHLVRDKVRGSQALILESNHDPRMLQEGPYPWAVKQRIGGRHGHLSNPTAAAFLAEIANDGLRHVVLAHLSKTNNDALLVRDLHQQAVNGSRITLTIARQEAATEVLSIGEG